MLGEDNAAPRPPKEAPVSAIRPLAFLLLAALPATAPAQFVGPGNNQEAQPQQQQPQQQSQQQGQAQPSQQNGQGQGSEAEDSGEEDEQGGDLQYQGRFEGPYKGTSIIKLRDPDNGATCYVYAPSSIPYRTPMRGGVSYGSNSIGSISCVE